MPEVKSSNIHSVDHDAGRNVLTVTFHDKAKAGAGARYEYANVGRDKYDALLAAESVGRHFNATILGQHPHTRL